MKYLLYFMLLFCYCCAETKILIDNQKVLYNLSKKSLPTTSEFKNYITPEDSVLIINTNRFEKESITVKMLLKDNPNAQTALSKNEVFLMEDGIVDELLARFINVVDKIILSDLRAIKMVAKDSSNNLIDKDLLYEESISMEILEKLKAKYGCNKILTYRIIGYTPQMETLDGKIISSKIRYILRVVEANKGIILYSSFVDFSLGEK